MTEKKTWGTGSSSVRLRAALCLPLHTFSACLCALLAFARFNAGVFNAQTPSPPTPPSPLPPTHLAGVPRRRSPKPRPLPPRHGLLQSFVAKKDILHTKHPIKSLSRQTEAKTCNAIRQRNCCVTLDDPQPEPYKTQMDDNNLVGFVTVWVED